jgi:aminomethyltransferase
MVDFAGYSMPVQYKDTAQAQSIIDSVKHVRSKAGLFDVSHMCSLRWRGKDAIKFVESVTVADVQGLGMNMGTLSVIPTEEGGIIDDTMITKTMDAEGEHIYQVINAGCADKDLAHFKAKMADFKGDVSLTVQWDDRGLYALQGPEAVKVMTKLAPAHDFKSMGFGAAADMKVAGIDCFVARCGYTGEDGFEIFVPGKYAVELWQKLIEEPEVMPSGLGARDTLRLEAGLCLYGHDIDDTTTPSMAGLSWTVGKARREPGATPFPGMHKILPQVADPKTVRKVRVGLVPKGAPAREGAEITSADGTVIGKVTSGAVSPILKHNISMGYIDKPHNKAGTEVMVKVRGKSSPAIVTKMPFVPTKYYKP